MAILTTGNTFADGDQVTSTKLNNIANAATFASGAVDDSTTQLSSGAIVVKDLGVSTGKIAASAVTTAKINASAVTTAKIADSNVTKAKIENVANMKALGNVSGSAAAPAEVAILDEDNMASNSATSLATQQSIKAYADSKVDGTGAGSFTTLAASGDVTFDTSTLKVDSTNNRVGIGTTSPSHNLDVNSGASNQVALFESTDATAYIELADNTGSAQLVTPSSGDFRIYTGGSGAGNLGTSRLTVKANGDVGIGDDTPSYKLDVNGTGRFTSTVQFDGQTQNYNGAYDIYRSGAGYLRHRIADQTLSLGVTNTAGTVHYPIVMAASSDVLIFNNEEGEMARFDTSGNLGIGTVSPSSTLHIENTTSSGAYINYDGQSNTEFGLRIESNADGGNFESDFGTGGTALLDLYANSAVVSGGDLLVARTQSATPVLLVKGNGNVGIGTASPSYLLDINDDAATGAGLRVTGGGGGGPLAQFVRDVSSSGNITINIAGGDPQFQLTSAGSDVMTIGLDDSANTFQVCAGSAVGSNEVLVVGTNGKVGIGETAPTAPLTVTSTTGGVLMPRMTTTQMNAISSPANGEMIYNTTANKFYGYANGAWVALH